MSGRKPMQTLSNTTTARERAKLARFIAAMLCEPSPACIDDLAHPAIRDELQSAAVALGIQPQLIDRVFEAHSVDAREESFVRLLGHTVRSECPPYELEYRSAEVFQQSQTLADIAGFYRAFGFDASGPLTEREDHVATEWEFLAANSMLESLATDEDQTACCRDAQRDFLSEHAAGWMPAFFERVRRSGPQSFLTEIVNLAEAVLRNWCNTLGVLVGPAWLELRPVDEEDSTITCGAPGAVELGPTLAAAMDEGA